MRWKKGNDNSSNNNEVTEKKNRTNSVFDAMWAIQRHCCTASERTAWSVNFLTPKLGNYFYISWKYSAHTLAFERHAVFS